MVNLLNSICNVSQNLIEAQVAQNIQAQTQIPSDLIEEVLDYLADDLYVKAACNEKNLTLRRADLLKNIKSITFVNNNLTDNYFLSIRHLFPKLEELGLRNCRLQFQPKFGMAPLAPMPFSSLSSVYLCRLDLTSYSMQVLTHSFASVSRVNLEACSLNNQGIKKDLAKIYFPKANEVIAYYDEEKKEEKLEKRLNDLSL